MTCWQKLGIDPTDELRIIKRAYAEKSRQFHPEEHPEEFRLLHDAYRTALDQVKRGMVAPRRRTPAPRKAPEPPSSGGSTDQDQQAHDPPAPRAGINSPKPLRAERNRRRDTSGFDNFDENKKTLIRLDKPKAIGTPKPPRRRLMPLADEPVSLADLPIRRSDSPEPPDPSGLSFDVIHQVEAKQESDQRAKIAGVISGLEALHRERRIASTWDRYVRCPAFQELMDYPPFFDALASFFDVNRSIRPSVWKYFMELFGLESLSKVSDKGNYARLYEVLTSRFPIKPGPINRIKSIILHILSGGLFMVLLVMALEAPPLVLVMIFTVIYIACVIVLQRRGMFERNPSMRFGSLVIGLILLYLMYCIIKDA